MDITELTKFLLTNFPAVSTDLPEEPEEDTSDLPTEKPWWNETAIYSRDGSVRIRSKNRPVHKIPQKPLIINTTPFGDPDAA